MRRLLVGQDTSEIQIRWRRLCGGREDIAGVY
jgi:hypothetical protein